MGGAFTKPSTARPRFVVNQSSSGGQNNTCIRSRKNALCIFQNCNKTCKSASMCVVAFNTFGAD